MLLERRTVSRKTPRDGRLEISAESAARLTALASERTGELRVTTGGATGRGRLEAMPCGCAKGAGGGHVHHFVESPLLMALVPETTVLVELEESTETVRVERAG
jgi:hypothetical protein